MTERVGDEVAQSSDDAGRDGVNDEEQSRKEQNRLGTINRWEPPEADWTAEYAWTRYRGPIPWPCPGAWVLDEPEGLAYRWFWFPEVGEKYGTESGVFDDHGGNSVDTFREAEAFLIGEDVADSVREEEIAWTLKLDGDEVFTRIEPERDDLMAAVAEVLTRYPDGDWRDVAPESGSLPPEIVSERERQRRREENESLDKFAPDGGLPESLDSLVEQAERKETITCRECGDEIRRRYVEEGRCVGCQYGGLPAGSARVLTKHPEQARTDGGGA